eukprot:4626054-Prorocentrum_lima.AAC.1
MVLCHQKNLGWIRQVEKVMLSPLTPGGDIGKHYMESALRVRNKLAWVENPSAFAEEPEPCS